MQRYVFQNGFKFLKRHVSFCLKTVLIVFQLDSRDEIRKNECLFAKLLKLLKCYLVGRGRYMCCEYFSQF